MTARLDAPLCRQYSNSEVKLWRLRFGRGTRGNGAAKKACERPKTGLGRADRTARRPPFPHNLKSALHCTALPPADSPVYSSHTLFHAVRPTTARWWCSRPHQPTDVFVQRVPARASSEPASQPCLRACACLPPPPPEDGCHPPGPALAPPLISPPAPTAPPPPPSPDCRVLSSRPRYLLTAPAIPKRLPRRSVHLLRLTPQQHVIRAHIRTTAPRRARSRRTTRHSHAGSPTLPRRRSAY